MDPSTREVPPPAAPAAHPASRVLRFRPTEGGPFGWEGVAVKEYKAVADHHAGVLRSVLVGAAGERTAFHLRYFEVAPGGFTSLEHHRHAHAVVVLRGSGEVVLGGEAHAVGYGDVVYVAAHEVHQFRNTSATGPFGFLCLVDAERDRPIVVAAPVDCQTPGSDVS